MRSRQASSAAHANTHAYDPTPWRDSVGLVIDLEARRVAAAAPAASPAPPPGEVYSWEGFETANTNCAPPPRSRDLGSRRGTVRDMSIETRLMICLFALLSFLAAPTSPTAPAPTTAAVHADVATRG